MLPKRGSAASQPLLEVVIIGAGQAGLVTARELIRRGMVPGQELVVLDANDAPGGAWQHRWDSLTVEQANHIEDLPGLKRADVIGSNDNVPSSEAISEYFESYEETFGLGVVRPAVVEAVLPHDEEGDNILVVEVRMGQDLHRLRTKTVISATGTWTRPFIPWVPGIDQFGGQQLHTVDFRQAEDFRDRRTLVVGGGLSAVHMLLELAPFTDTLWSTRRPPEFRAQPFGGAWGRQVEESVREKTRAGLRAGSVVGNTGIPPHPEYLDAVDAGILVSRGQIRAFTKDAVVFRGSEDGAEGDSLAVPSSWAPHPAGASEPIDVIFWNTGFRPALSHLAPLHLRSVAGGITMEDEVTVALDPRIFLVGYGSSASTRGAIRAGRAAAQAVLEKLSRR